MVGETETGTKSSLHQLVRASPSMTRDIKRARQGLGEGMPRDSKVQTGLAPWYADSAGRWIVRRGPMAG